MAPNELKKSVHFSFEKLSNLTLITATATDSELPTIRALLTPVWKNAWNIYLIDITNTRPIFQGTSLRGRSFAERLAREIIRGCFSKLGKRRRFMANKQKKAKVK